MGGCSELVRDRIATLGMVVRAHRRPPKKVKMMFDNVELFAKAMAGETLSEDESKQLRAHDIRYSLVRFLYMEKMQAEGVQLKDFHFTSGDNFAKTPILDIVNSLVEVHNEVKNGNYKPYDFGDLSLKKVEDNG